MKKLYSWSTKILRNIILPRDIIMYDTIVKKTTELPFLVPINVSAKNRLKGGVKSDKLSHKTLLKGEDMRAVVGQDVFVFQVPERAFPDWRTTRPRAYSRIRAHTRARHYFSSPPRGTPSLARRLALAPGTLSRSLARQIFISRTPVAPLCHSRRLLLLRLIPKRDAVFHLCFFTNANSFVCSINVDLLDLIHLKKILAQT